nr:GtrA family protein [Anaerolineae bacterium]
MEDTAQPAHDEGSILTRLREFVRHNKEFERFWKFAVVGTIGAVIDFGTFTLLNAAGWLDNIRLSLPFGAVVTGLGISGTIAFVLAIFSNFIWNRYWTYPDSRSKPVVGQLVTFFAINVVGILIRLPILELLSRPFSVLVSRIVPSIGAEVHVWLGESAAWALAVVIVLFWNFFVNRYVTYNDVN